MNALLAKVARRLDWLVAVSTLHALPSLVQLGPEVAGVALGAVAVVVAALAARGA